MKPDAVDNEAIEELVNRFLNGGSFENDKEDLLNRDALNLINSSIYWNTEGLQVDHQ